jgi:hypothetical protein
MRDAGRRAIFEEVESKRGYALGVITSDIAFAVSMILLLFLPAGPVRWLSMSLFLVFSAVGVFTQLVLTSRLARRVGPRSTVERFWFEASLKRHFMSPRLFATAVRTVLRPHETS